MVFSSSEFLFFFLPIVLILYYLVRKNRTLANAVLTVMSLLFYAWGEPKFVLVMLGSIALNWPLALAIDKNAEKPRVKKLWLTLGIVMNVCILGVFKYTSFAVRNLNALGFNLIDPKIVLPIGISFFTFQAMSYIIDIYRGKAACQKHFMGVCLYIAFFPQLIAGPIVRYETVAQEILYRKETKQDFTEGTRRFIVGLAKKAIVANALASFVDKIYALETSSTSVVLTWLAAIAYLMQVYYDFSGYSDMAIGLGRMFGFHFLENFNMPFISKTVAEFWRRWHISMCTWFRDYVFFPLGGSRVKSKFRLLFNMFAVWALTGLWHGAEWTFVCWGVGFFAIQAIEKMTGLGKHMEKHWYGHAYAMLFVVLITVMIRSSSMTAALDFYKTMFGLGGAVFTNGLTALMLKEYLWALIVGVVCSLPTANLLKKCVSENAWEIISGVGVLVSGVLAVICITSGSYNPFIYFNF